VLSIFSVVPDRRRQLTTEYTEYTEKNAERLEIKMNPNQV
jgi:hypothetical protein